MDLNRCPTEEARLRSELWLQMIRTYDLLQSKVTASLQPHNLTLPQFEVLSTLAISACTNQQELAQRLQVTKGNLVGLIDRLTERGWVEREADPEDRRVNKVRITKAGKDLLEKVYPEQLSAVEGSLSILSSAEVETMKTLLKKLESVD